jgi:hypothetical protein
MMVLPVQQATDHSAPPATPPMMAPLSP